MRTLWAVLSRPTEGVVGPLITRRCRLTIVRAGGAGSVTSAAAIALAQPLRSLTLLTGHPTRIAGQPPTFLWSLAHRTTSLTRRRRAVASPKARHALDNELRVKIRQQKNRHRLISIPTAMAESPFRAAESNASGWSAFQWDRLYAVCHRCLIAVLHLETTI